MLLAIESYYHPANNNGASEALHVFIHNLASGFIYRLTNVLIKFAEIKLFLQSIHKYQGRYVNNLEKTTKKPLCT